jgi:molecular chaperone GrpE (heat shock protein)
MRADVLQRLSEALQISLPELLSTYSGLVVQPSAPASTAQMQQEYERLQVQLEQQREVLQQEFQQMCLRSLESWLIQFPTLAYAAQQNPQFPSKNFLPFLRPLEQLLQGWGVEAIAPVGAEIPYDPQLHQLMEGTAQPGDWVKVRYRGYRQGEKLLYRAKVSLVGA